MGPTLKIHSEIDKSHYKPLKLKRSHFQKAGLFRHSTEVLNFVPGFRAVIRSISRWGHPFYKVLLCAGHQIGRRVGNWSPMHAGASQNAIGQQTASRIAKSEQSNKCLNVDIGVP